MCSSPRTSKLLRAEPPPRATPRCCPRPPRPRRLLPSAWAPYQTSHRPRCCPRMTVRSTRRPGTTPRCSTCSRAVLC
jgi:hypothetical protein